MTEFYLFYCS